jgi:biotin carboxylase
LPEYFLLPDEINEFEEHIKESEDSTYIAKPSKGKAGKGIRLLKSFKELPKSAYE